MAGTKIQSVRTPTVIEGAGKYEIISTCVTPGALPDTGIFLLNIPDPTGPKSDTLIRVIELGDPSIYNADRDAAIASGDSQWRSPSVRLVYDDLETANAAQKELAQRINQLVLNFDTQNSEFTVTNEIVTYPINDPSVQTEAKNKYKDARAAANAAQDARNAHVTECAAIESELNQIEERLVEAQSDYATLSAAQAVLLTLNGTYSAHLTNFGVQATSIATANNASGATPTEKTQINGYVTNIQLEAQVMAATNTSLNTAVSGPSNSTAALLGVLTARVNSLTSEKAAKNIQFRQCSFEATTSQAALDAARAAEDEALASVRALCPDFDPTTV